mgnify:FL=1|tara:strand:- start:1267 stop:1446 length:180 start_codon:yes stop_codon:yes gene_type:complete
MPRKSKPKTAPSDYFDMKGSVEKEKKVKMNEVFGKDTGKKKNKKGSEMKKKKPKKKSTY